MKKLRDFPNLSRLTEAQALQQVVRIVEERSQQIHRNFMCWRSVPGVYLKMILGCIDKIPFSALNLKVLLEPGQREVAFWKMLQLLEFVAGIDKDEVVGGNRCTQYHAMAMIDRNEERGRRWRVLLLQSGFIMDGARRVHIDELGRAHHDQRIGATECFDTRLDAQSADAKVTIDIPLQRVRTEGTQTLSVFLRRLRRRFLRGGFLSHVLICIAKQSGQLEFQNEPVEPLPRASTVRAPLTRYVRRPVDRDWVRTSRTSSRSSPLATRWSVRVESRAMQATSCQTMVR